MSLERLEVTPLTALLSDIITTRGTGVLTVVIEGTRKSLYWAQGELVMATSTDPRDWLTSFLVARGVVAAESAQHVVSEDPTEVVTTFFESKVIESSTRKQALLREWLTSVTLPLFSLMEGTVAFSPDNAIDPEKRIFLQSTAALVLEGIRSIQNGLILRRSLGDIKRTIERSPRSRFDVHNLPLTSAEQTVEAVLTEPLTIEAILKKNVSDSLTTAKTIIAMLTLGVWGVAEARPQASSDTVAAERDLALLASIGAADTKSLRAVALSRQLPSIDFYQLLDVPRGATRAQITLRGDELKQSYDPSKYPAVVREYVQAIARRIDDAVNVLKDPIKRQEYDKLLARPRDQRGHDVSMQQKIAQRSIAEQNYKKAEELTILGDYYGAIVLLRQTVTFAPDHAAAWYLLGSCQQRNPKWRRDAMDSFQRAISINANHVEAMLSLGDLYRANGLVSRAQACYEDALAIEPDNGEAKSRLKGLK